MTSRAERRAERAYAFIHPCTVCARPSSTHRRDGRCVDCRGVRVVGVPAAVSPTARYEADKAAQHFVEVFPDGAPLDVVAAALGVCRERIRQIQAGALDKLRSAPEFSGWSAEDVGAFLGAKRGGEQLDTLPAYDHYVRGAQPGADLGETALRIDEELGRVEQRLAAVLEVVELAEEIEAGAAAEAAE